MPDFDEFDEIDDEDQNSAPAALRSAFNKAKKQNAELAKQRSAHAARPHVRGRLWQRGYFDRVLRDDEDPYEVVRYVVQNPVRARLVEQIQAYPFVGSSILALQDLLDHCAWKPR